MTVHVIKAFSHAGRAVAVGARIEVDPMTAAILHRRGVVSLSVPNARNVIADPAPAPSAASQRKPRKPREPKPSLRRYRRRDLVPEG